MYVSFLTQRKPSASRTLMKSARFLVKSLELENPSPVTHCSVTLSKIHILSEPLFPRLKKKNGQQYQIHKL